MAHEIKVADWNPIKLMVAVPSGALGNIATQALLDAEHCSLIHGRLTFYEPSISALTLAHNLCLCEALNAYRAGHITHLLIMHSDIRPVMAHWAELLVGEMQRANADLLGCITVIKNGIGLTSTAFDTDPWNPQRLTLKQAKALPVTWTAPTLLLNTGLLLLNLAAFADKPLVRFTVNDKIEEVDGKFVPSHEPEDWNFSRQCHERGLRVFVTRGIEIRHAGIALYPNAPAYGAPVDVDMVTANGPVVVTDADGEQHTFDPREPLL